MSSESGPSWADVRDGTLERLVEQARPLGFLHFREQLFEACAEVVAQSRGRALAFVGRSPESLYDLLRGVFRDTRRAPRLVLVPFSLRDHPREAARRAARAELDGLDRHFAELGLDPASIAADERGVAFVDFVAYGTTIGNLNDALEVLAECRRVDVDDLRRKVSYVGLVKASLGWTHWRADGLSDGTRLFDEGRASVVPIPSRLWGLLGDQAPKTMDSHTRARWPRPCRLPPLDEERAEAIRLARDLRRVGQSREARRDFASRLARRAKGERAWLGSLVAGLLRSTRRRR
jgi:hypothetical protein